LYHCEHGVVDLMGLKSSPQNPIFLQCFDIVSLVIWLVKTRPRYDL